MNTKDDFSPVIPIGLPSPPINAFNYLDLLSQAYFSPPIQYVRTKRTRRTHRAKARASGRIIKGV